MPGIIIGIITAVATVTVGTLVYFVRRRGGEDRLGPQPEPPDKPKV